MLFRSVLVASTVAVEIVGVLSFRHLVGGGGLETLLLLIKVRFPFKCVLLEYLNNAEYLYHRLSYILSPLL